MFGRLRNMNLKMLAIWLSAIGLIALVLGAVIGVATFDPTVWIVRA